MAFLNPTHINDMMQAMLDVACNCLEDTPLGAPADCYISHNQPPDDCCFAAETEVVTDRGVFPIEELSGRTVRLMTTEGVWVDAPIRPFGVQPLRKVTLVRHRQERIVYATGNHRWLLDQRASTRWARSLKECLTDNLKPGDHLAVESGESWSEMDAKGIAAGVVFGDGSATPWGCRVTFYGQKAPLADLLADFGREGRGDSRHAYSRSVSGLPSHWKNLPDVDGDKSFLLGWLAGYVATDGSVNAKSVRLSSATRLHLERTREICYRLGIVTSEIQEQWRRGFGDVDSPVFSISFTPSTLPDGFFVRSDQAIRSPLGKKSPARWTVVSVDETDRLEQVYCATVPETRAFVLAGNILTGNCDFLSIWLERIRPRVGFENAQYITGEKVWAKCGDIGGVADVALRLMRPCFPVAKDNATNPFPTATEMQAAAENLLIDVQVLRCCISASYCAGLLFPDTPDADCLELAIGDIVPAGPRGGCAGWTLYFAIELDSCWYGDLPASS